MELPEHSEGSILKSFSAKKSPIFNKGNLVYSKAHQKFFRVVDLKTDDSYNPTWASIVSKDGNDKLEISKAEEFDQYFNYIDVLLAINSEANTTTTLEVRLKIYDKLETALEGPFQGAGYSLMAYKLYFNQKELAKDNTLASIDDIKEGDSIYASMGFGKPYVFKRFPRVYTSYGWSNSGNYPDGIAFIPNQSIKV